MTKAYPLLLETIKIEEGKIYNLSYHQKRCDKSRLDLYNATDTLSLRTIIKPPKRGLYRCRILYNTTLQNIEYIPYQEKEIKTLAIVETNLIYNYKYANRDAINELATLNSDMDDILIVQDGYIQDTSIANIAFYDSTTWFTPSQPLLKGTMREKLIDEGFLQVKAIKKEDLYKYSQVALMNAMIGFRVLKNITIYDKVGKVYDY
jgi:4-amino-4-deoxychorismate lyase